MDFIPQSFGTLHSFMVYPCDQEKYAPLRGIERRIFIFVPDSFPHFMHFQAIYALNLGLFKVLWMVSDWKPSGHLNLVKNQHSILKTQMQVSSPVKLWLHMKKLRWNVPVESGKEKGLQKLGAKGADLERYKVPHGIQRLGLSLSQADRTNTSRWAPLGHPIHQSTRKPHWVEEACALPLQLCLSSSYLSPDCVDCLIQLLHFLLVPLLHSEFLLSLAFSIYFQNYSLPVHTCLPSIPPTFPFLASLSSLLQTLPTPFSHYGIGFSQPDLRPPCTQTQPASSVQN